MVIARSMSLIPRDFLAIEIYFTATDVLMRFFYAVHARYRWFTIITFHQFSLDLAPLFFSHPHSDSYLLQPQLWWKTQLDKSCQADVTVGHKSKNDVLYILSEKAHACWIILNGEAQNSMCATSHLMTCQAISSSVKVLYPSQKSLLITRSLENLLRSSIP